MPGVQLLGQVKDLQSLYNRARVFVAPLQFASGIPIKVLDAAAAGLPIVATNLMAIQVGWAPGVEIEAADDAAQLAEAAIALHDDIKRWECVRTSALHRVSCEYSEQTFRRSLLEVLEPATPVLVRPPQSKDVTDAHRVSRVNSVWGADKSAVERGQAWMTHPAVRGCINRRASGDPNSDAFARLKQLLTEMVWVLPVESAISLCCGNGELERGLAKLNLARRIVGYDLATTAIRRARALASAGGWHQLEYEVRDLEDQGIDLNNVDLILAHSAVHHISGLEALFDAVHRALKSGGIFHLYEYVGPDRFQWTDKQLAEINYFLERLPERYRRLPGGQLRSRISRPTVEEMLKFDPSEAVRSSQIERLVGERFHIVERRALGGALLHMALADIAQNFDPANVDDQMYVQQLIEREDRLMAEGSLNSDFVVIVAKREE
jgi:SAM-dependent methyltransferase